MITGSTQIVNAWDANLGEGQRRIYLDYWEYIEDAAKIRQDMHAGLGHRGRNMGDDLRAHKIGLAGEFEFALRFGGEVDMTLRPFGDGGVDFRMNGYTIDVKTAEKPWYLLYLEEKLPVAADIYVLAGCNLAERESWLIGWEWGETLEKGEMKEFIPGYRNRAIHHSKLRSLDSLREILCEV